MLLEIARLIENFDRRNRRIVDDGLEDEIDLSLRGGADVREGLGNHPQAAAFLMDVEIF